ARVRFVDDLAALLATDPRIVREDTRVRKRVTAADPGRFAVVVGKDASSALEALDLATLELEAAKKKGVVAYYMPLGSFLRSPSAQRASLRAARSGAHELKTALASKGFRTELFSPYFEAIKAERILTLEAVLASPLGDVVRPMAPKIEDKQAFVLPLG